MGRVDVVEGGRSKSPSPARREAAAGVPSDKGGEEGGKDADKQNNGDTKRQGVSDESGYFEGEEEGDREIKEEDSVEIIFDKNASNNNITTANRKSAANTGRMRITNSYYIGVIYVDPD